MLIKKIKNKRLRIAVRLAAAVFVVGILVYSFVYPALTKKTAHETLADITKKSGTSSSSKISKPGGDTSTPTGSSSSKDNAPNSSNTSNNAAAVEKPVQAPQPTVVKSGVFRGAQGESVSGQASLVTFEGKNFLRLGDDFASSNGPDLYVGFGSPGGVDKSTLFSKLKATSGGQNYEIPSNIDPSAYSQVYIFCKIYNHTYGVADLN